MAPVAPVSLTVCSVGSTIPPVFAALGSKLCIRPEPPIHQPLPSITLSEAPRRNHLNNGSMACQHETMKFTTNVGMKRSVILTSKYCSLVIGAAASAPLSWSSSGGEQCGSSARWPPSAPRTASGGAFFLAASTKTTSALALSSSKTLWNSYSHA